MPPGITRKEPDREPRAIGSPVGFGVEVLAKHANFPNRVAAGFQMEYEGYDGAVVSDLPLDASSVVVAKVRQPEGTSGWHTHPGPVLVSIVGGEIDDEACGRAGGIYVFDSEESRDASFESEIHAKLRDGSDIRDLGITTFHVVFPLYESGGSRRPWPVGRRPDTR